MGRSRNGARLRSTGSRRALDVLLLVAAGVLVSAALLGAVFLLPKHRTSALWYFGLCYAAIFTLVAAKFTGSKFRRPLFLIFFLLGLAVQEAASLWAAWWWGGAAAIASLVLGSAVFLRLAALWFGPISVGAEKSGTRGGARL